jgi:hypothetical protein
MDAREAYLQFLIDRKVMGDPSLEAFLQLLSPIDYIAALRRAGRFSEAERRIATIDWERVVR